MRLSLSVHLTLKLGEEARDGAPYGKGSLMREESGKPLKEV